MAPSKKLLKKKEVEQQADSLAFSPYRVFTREEWARLRADTPMTLHGSEIEQLSGVIEEVSADEVEQIHLPLSRLLNLYVAAAQKLNVTRVLPGHGEPGGKEVLAGEELYMTELYKDTGTAANGMNQRLNGAVRPGTAASTVMGCAEDILARVSRDRI